MPSVTDTNFFARAEMLDTRAGQMKNKDDPAVVAKAAFEGLMADKDRVIPTLKNKAMAAGAEMMSDTAAAQMHRGLSEPGSGKMTEGPAMSVDLTLVAEFDHQVTGVAISETGRIFVNFPRWTEDSPISVAELVDGQPRAYPDARWNEWRNARKNELSAQDRFVCVQSVVCDGRGGLWVLDPAAPGQQQVVPGGPKLVRIDLATDQVTKVIAFDPALAPQGSYLNDVRFHPNGATAYITDSGAKGALLVIDLGTGETRRVLDGHPSTQPEKDVVVKTDGEPLRRPDGRGAEFAADSLEVTPDGAFVVYQALTGRTVYRVPTEALDDPSLSADALGAQVETLASIGVSDGYWMDRQGRLYMSAVEDNAVRVREPSGEVVTLVQDERLRWPDSFAQHPDGAIHVTTSRIQDSMWFKPETGPALRTQLWRLDART
jgi:sugar lactone lactonase YvrE